MRSSSVVAPGTRSDMSMPRLSNMITRANSASRSHQRLYCGNSHAISRWVYAPST